MGSQAYFGSSILAANSQDSARMQQKIRREFSVSICVDPWNLCFTQSKEFWAHCRAFQFSPDCIYAHVHKLASTCISTKESLEDIIGDLGDHIARDSKPSSLTSPERVYFNNANSKRLHSMPFINMKKGDYTNQQAKTFGQNRYVTFGDQVVIGSKLTTEVKKLCGAGTSEQRNAMGEIIVVKLGAMQFPKKGNTRHAH